MNQVEIDIQENGAQKRVSFLIASKWDEVEPGVYPVLAMIYLTGKGDRYHKTLASFAILAHKAWPEVNLQPEELYDLLPLVDWVFDKLDLKINLQPVIRINEIDFIGPADELENLRFAEWCAADTFFVNYSEAEDIHQLHQLAAVLYRPAGVGDAFNPDHHTWKGDKREKFNDQLLKSRTKLMAALPDKVIYGIYLFYASCRKMIIDSYPVTFPEKKENESGEEAPGWLDIYDDLRADPKYTGDSVLDEELLHSCLFSMERNNKKMAKLKLEYDI